MRKSTLNSLPPTMSLIAERMFHLLVPPWSAAYPHGIRGNSLWEAMDWRYVDARPYLIRFHPQDVVADYQSDVVETLISRNRIGPKPLLNITDSYIERTLRDVLRPKRKLFELQPDLIVPGVVDDESDDIHDIRNQLSVHYAQFIDFCNFDMQEYIAFQEQVILGKPISQNQQIKLGTAATRFVHLANHCTACSPKSAKQRDLDILWMNLDGKTIECLANLYNLTVGGIHYVLSAMEKRIAHAYAFHHHFGEDESSIQELVSALRLRWSHSWNIYKNTKPDPKQVKADRWMDFYETLCIAFADPTDPAFWVLRDVATGKLEELLKRLTIAQLQSSLEAIFDFTLGILRKYREPQPKKTTVIYEQTDALSDHDERQHQLKNHLHQPLQGRAENSPGV